MEQGLEAACAETGRSRGDIVRVVFDSNGLVIAFLARGLCADLLRLVLIDHTLVASEVVLAELCEA